MSDIETPLHPSAYRQSMTRRQYSYGNIAPSRGLGGGGGGHAGVVVGTDQFGRRFYGSAWGPGGGGGSSFRVSAGGSGGGSSQSAGGGGGGEYACEPAICNCHSCRVGAGYHRPSG